MPEPGTATPGASRTQAHPPAGPVGARRPTALAAGQRPRETEPASEEDRELDVDGPRDELLAARAAAGEIAAFEALLRRYGARVLACLERLLGEHHRALDASQEVWLKVHRALPAFDATRRFRPWLFAIAMNHARDRLRERPRREETLAERHSEELPAELPGPGAALLERSAIAAALARIAEPFRTALLLVDVAGNDYPEAAEALGLPVGTVKSRVHRARLCFRAAYAELEAQQACSQAPSAAPPEPPGSDSAPPRRRG
jgi:RNA polymerase sigma-70 factor (ECF subfamily)